MLDNFPVKRTVQILILISIFIASFCLRWGYVRNTSIIQPIRADAYSYVKIAYNLTHHHVYSSADDPQGKSSPETRPPGYTFFLAGIMLLTDSFDSFYLSTLYIQCLMGAMIVLLTYALSRFLLSPMWSLLPTCLVMVSPHMIMISAYVLSESLFTFLLLMSMVSIALAYKSEKPIDYALAGSILGACIFVRPVLAVFPILCAAVIYFLNRHRNRRVILLSIILFLLTSFSFQLSWSVWKRVSFGPDPAMSNQLKTAVLCGVYPDITYKNIPGMPYREDTNFDSLLQEGYGAIGLEIMRRFKDNPFQYAVWWLLEKPAMFWSWKIFFNDGINVYPVRFSWFDINPLMNILRQTMLTIHLPFVILAFMGIFFLIKKPKRLNKSPSTLCYLLCLVLLVHFTLMFMILAPFPRYSLPMGPAVYLLGIVTLRKSFDKYKSIKAGLNRKETKAQAL